MFSDAQKLSLIDSSIHIMEKIKSKFVVGLFLKENTEKVFSYINNYIIKSKYQLTEDDYMLIRYNKTKWYLLIIQVDKVLKII